MDVGDEADYSLAGEFGQEGQDVEALAVEVEENEFGVRGGGEGGLFGLHKPQVGTGRFGGSFDFHGEEKILHDCQYLFRHNLRIARNGILKVMAEANPFQDPQRFERRVPPAP